MSDNTMPNLYEQLLPLISEVRFHTQKCDQALAKIEDLLSAARDQVNVSVDFPANVTSETLQRTFYDLQGPVSQIQWPHRSQRVLRDLNLMTLEDTVEYFSDFNHFVKGRDITLWEWSVITNILRQADLLINSNVTKTSLNDKIIDILPKHRHDGLSARVFSTLARYANTQSIQDLMKLFANGAENGWEKIAYLHNFGRHSRSFLIDNMSSWAFYIPAQLCYPTGQSDIVALELHSCMFARHNINTISELITACQDDDPSRGLRYIAPEEYQTAIKQLRNYGF